MFPLAFTIPALVLVYLIITFLLNAFLSIGEVYWWERVAVAFWPVTLPVLLIVKLLFAIFWPEY